MRLLLLAIDQFDQRLLQRCVDAGAMPALAALLDRGCSGALSQPQPHAAAALWATVATGWPACRHGILADQAVGPSGHGARAPQAVDWRAQPFWQHCGASVAVLNWPGTAPAATPSGPESAARPDPSPGWLRAPGAARGDAPLQAWALDPATVSPAGDLDAVRALRVHPDDITPLMLDQLLSGLSEAERSAPLLAACRATIAELASWQTMSLDLLAQGCQQLVLRWDALASLAAELLRPDGRLALARPWQLLGNLCHLMDLMLQALLVHLDADGHVLLVCAGSLPPALRPDARGVFERGDPGFAVMAGPGFAPDALREGGSLFDVLPSLHSVLGLAEPEGMPGRNWHRPSRATAPLGLDSPVTLPRLLGPSDLPAPAAGESPGADWLRWQGLTLPDLAPLRQIATQAHAQQLQGLALSLREGGHDGLAAQALDAALAAAPQATGPQWLALLWAVERSDAAAARELIERSPELAAALPPGDLREAVLACAAQAWAQAEPLLRRLLPGDHLPLNLRAWLGHALAALGRHAEAEETLMQALDHPCERLGTAQRLARVQLQLGRHAAAEASARRCIALAPDHATGHALLGEAMASTRRLDAAIMSQWRACQLAPQQVALRARWAELVRAQRAGG